VGGAFGLEECSQAVPVHGTPSGGWRRGRPAIPTILPRVAARG